MLWYVILTVKGYPSVPTKIKKETSHLLEAILSLQPSQYINTLLVPKDGQIPVDVQCLASQGIFHVVRMPSTFI